MRIHLSHGCPLSFARYVKCPESAAAENKVCASWPARIVGISKSLRAKDAFETRVKVNSPTMYRALARKYSQQP